LATSAVVATETLVPAALGITFLGDRTARGDGALAAAGFAITVAGSLMLARYGEAPSTAPATDPQAGDDTQPADDTKRDHGVRARFSS
jgi:hypothetical protein